MDKNRSQIEMNEIEASTTWAPLMAMISLESSWTNGMRIHMKRWMMIVVSDSARAHPIQTCLGDANPI